MLAWEALKFYCYQNGIIFNIDNVEVKKLHYIPLLEDDENQIYIHTDSLVSFCHRFGGDRFNDLTRTYFNKEFVTFKIISKNGTSKSFRIISKEEFEKICK